MFIPSDIAELLKQNFDKIFVVSIPHFTDRHAMLTDRLGGLSFDYFWGVDKQQLDIKDLQAKNIYNEKIAIKNQRNGKPLNLGEIACSLSHRMVYEEMVKHGWKKVLVLEDDVVPKIDNFNFLADSLQELPENWELVYLGYLKHENITSGLKRKRFFYKILSRIGLIKWDYRMVENLLPTPYSKHLKNAGFHDCTHAYAVSLTGAKKMIEAQTPVVYRADDLLSTLTMKGKLNAFICKYKFFDQECFHNTASISTIKD